MHAGHQKRRVLSLIVWNIVVWISAAHLSGKLAAQVSASAPSDQQAQIDRGRQVVGQTCVACHTNILRMVQIHKQSAEQWRDTVYLMIGRGAQIMPDEIEPVTAFLAANAGGNRQTTTQASGGGRQGAGGSGQGLGQQTPGAEGRAILQRTCQQCHDMATATTKLASEDWTAVIGRMTSYGAKLSPADQQKLIEYLNGLAK
jgi:mono/diheme cytochrome c family protein